MDTQEWVEQLLEAQWIRVSVHTASLELPPGWSRRKRKRYRMAVPAQFTIWYHRTETRYLISWWHDRKLNVQEGSLPKYVNRHRAWT